MVKRLAVAAVGIPAAFYLVYLGGWALAATLSILGALGALEVYRLAEVRSVRPLKVVGVAGALALPFTVLLLDRGSLDLRWAMLLGTAWLMIIMLVALRARPPASGPLSAVAVTAFGTLYAAGLPAFLVWLRQTPSAPSAWAATWLVFLPLALTWACDTLAMLGGSLMGGPKLAPRLSPGKTWSGAVAGGVGAILLGPVYGMLVLDRTGMHIPLAALLLAGAGIGTLGQLGDLAESLFKRDAGVKDSGTFFPGHGGVLDRLDSLYWGIPTTVMILRAFAVV